MDDQYFRGGTAVVTGAGSGPGASMVQRFAAAGMAIVITRHLESSALARPAELGKSELRREDIDVMMASRKMDAANHVATAEHATRYLLTNLAADARYIITHGEYRESIVSTYEEILRAHDRAHQRCRGGDYCAPSAQPRNRF